MSTKKSALENAMAKLAKELSADFERQNGILHEGDRIILPELMGNDEAARLILAQEKMMNEESSQMMDFENAHPADALNAFYESVKDEFGSLVGKSMDMGFMKIAAKAVYIDIAYGEKKSIPVGLAVVPGLNIQFKIVPYLNENHPNGGQLSVEIKYKKLYQPLVDRIEKNARKRLTEDSIFQGKAIDSSYQFLNPDFDPSRVVYSDSEYKQVVSEILEPIVNADGWIASGNSPKIGVLLHGAYGTGKSLTALLVAYHAIRNGHTFIMVKPGHDIVHMLNFAMTKQPAVLFFEDIDTETSGGRTDRISEILNTIDSIVGKRARLMTILTTNYPENIYPGLLRQGRLNAIIEQGKLDPKSVVKLIRVVAQNMEGIDLLEGDLDSDAVWKVAEGYTPAFIVGAVDKAKAYALTRQRLEGNGHGLAINQDDVISALQALRPQWEMMHRSIKAERPALEESMSRLVEEKARVMETQERLSDLESNLSTTREYVENTDNNVGEIRENVELIKRKLSRM